MKNMLIVICEGDTEVKLVDNLIHERLSNHFYPIIPKTLITGKNPEGGNAAGNICN